MYSENNIENKIIILEKQIIELQEKITKLETIILTNNYNYSNFSNYYNDNYNINNDVIMDPIINRSISLSEPPLTRQNAFTR